MPTTYTPILRNRQNERAVIRDFNRSALPGSPSPPLTMVPLIEITDEDDLGELTPFRDAGEFIMVDLPRYLTERSNEFEDDVEDIINRYGTVERFYLDNSEQVDIPVISGPIEPVDYSVYTSEYQALEEHFNRIAVRLMIRDFTEAFTGDQRQSLESLAEVVSKEDIILFDLVDNGVNSTLEKDLNYLSELFDNNRRVVMNAFDAYNGYSDNESPELADRIGAEGFGDFGINQRFKPKGGGRPKTAKVRHYHPNHGTVRVFDGPNYREAGENLTDWSKFRRGHCDGCRQADRTSNDSANTWSQIRMQHYFSSVLRDEI